MSESNPHTLAQRIGAHFGEKIVGIVEALGETTVEVLPENLLVVAKALRDDEAFRFEQAMDVSGVDYLSYGQSEWDTTDVSAQGFSRGVEGDGPGLFQWSNRPMVGAGGHKRFAAVVHLLSIKHNWRVGLRCHAQDDWLPVVPSLTSV